jgi:hypothetical protein
VGMSPLDACVWGNERRLGQRRWQRGELWQFQREGRYADERGRGRFWLLRLRPHGRRLRRAAHGARRARAWVVGTRERGLGCAAAPIVPDAPARLHTAQRSERRQHAHPQRQHPQNPSAQRTVEHSEMHDTPTLPRAVGRQAPTARAGQTRVQGSQNLSACAAVKSAAVNADALKGTPHCLLEAKVNPCPLRMVTLSGLA